METDVRVETAAIQRTDTRAQPRGRWLALAQAAWMVCAVCAVLIFLAAIPLGYASLFSGSGFHELVDAPAWYVAIMKFAQGAVSLLAALVSLALAGLILLMQYFAAPRLAALPQAFPELTEREREILALIAQHQTNMEIAEQLSLSPKTVRNHVSNIFTKLQVADRAQAIIRAREAGLGKS